MIGNKETSGANLRLIGRAGKERKKRIFNAALHKGESVDRGATRNMLQHYFDGTDEEEKKPTQYSLLTALIVVLISFYIVWPQFLNVIDISKDKDEIYIPAGGWSAPPQTRVKKERVVETKKEEIPQLYPEIEDLPKLEEEEVEIETDSEWAQLDVQGDIGNVEFGLGGSGGGPVLDAGAGGLVPEPELLFRVEPDYPEPARRSRVDGFVLLQAIVNQKGDVIDVKVLQTPPARFGFAEKAIEAVTQWKFKPSMYKGKPVSVRIRFSVEFNLVY